MDKVLHWLKGNVAIVVFGVVIVVAPILAFILSSRWNQSVLEEAQARARKLSEIEAIAKTNVSLTIPGGEPISLTTAVNQRLLDEYKRITEELKGDAGRVREQALAHNKRNHGLLIPRLFPEMPAVERDTLPPEMYETVLAAYRRMLESIKGASPVSPDEAARAVARREEDYITGTLRKKSRSELEASEVAELTTELTKARLAKYGEPALSSRVYVDLSALPLPSAALKASASEAEMFAWQWNFWLVDDILQALNDANVAVGGRDGRIATNPVKHILSIRPLDALSFGGMAAPDGPGAPGGSGRRSPNFGGMGAGGNMLPPAAEGGGDAGGAAPPAGGADAARDYKASFTGRVSNALFDVRPVEVRLVVAMDKIPAIIDALAKRNFMTVLDVDLQPADPFAAAARGFIYGTDPVAELTLVLETVWLREWTTPFMPRQVKEHLKIPVAPPPGAAPPDGAPPEQAGG